jgi:hypothetical protein
MLQVMVCLSRRHQRWRWKLWVTAAEASMKWSLNVPMALAQHAVESLGGQVAMQRHLGIERSRTRWEHSLSSQ